MSRKILVLALFAALAWSLWNTALNAPLAEELARVVEAPSGFAAAVGLDKAPLQTTIEDRPVIRVDDYAFTLVADFQLEARVLGRRDYRLGAESRLSPIDLALGWGPMARDDIVEQVSIRQRGRFYFWRVESYPIEHAAIVENSANMHMIPASPEVFAELKRAERHRHIRLRGYLVNVERSDGWLWRSSTSRSDSGHGACELILVTAVQVY